MLLAGWDLGAQYFAGYVVEKSLSVDNLFVFVIIISAFAVPASQQPKALTIGIVIALGLRAVFIALGAALLAVFSFMFLIFGLSLIDSGGVRCHPARLHRVANAFALLGLRPLFFLVSGLLDPLVYLSSALALILAFIGVKLVLQFVHQRDHSIPEVSTTLSLAVVAVVIAATTVASLITVRRNPGIRAHAGSLRRPAEDQPAQSID